MLTRNSRWLVPLLCSIAALCSVAALADDGAPAAPAEPAKVYSAEDQARRAKPLVTYSDGEITVGELEDAITSQSPFMQKRYSDPAQQKLLLEKRLRFALLAKEADTRGFGRNESVLQAVKQNAVQNMMKEEFDDKLTPEMIPAEAVKVFYDEHSDEFLRPATRRASHIVLATKAEADTLLAEAKGMDMRQFRQTARDKSIDEGTKMRGGDLRYFATSGKSRDEGQPGVSAAVAKAVFALKSVGDTVERPIKTDGGFALLKMTGQRPANNRTLAQADETIRMRLWREKRQAAISTFLTKLRADLKPEIHPELLGKIKFDKKDVPNGKGVPQGFPAGGDIVKHAH